MNRGSSGGTFTRAKCSLPEVGLRTSTARLSERPEMYGKGCAGSTASGVSTGKICLRKNLCSRSCSLPPELVPVQQLDADLGELGLDVVGEDARVPAGELLRLGADGVEDLARGEARGRGDGHAGGHAPLEAGDADHVELVEVGGEDRQEPGPLEEREVLVLGLLEHPLVERQPAQLPVGEAALGQLGLRRRQVVLERLGAGLLDLAGERGRRGGHAAEHAGHRPGLGGQLVVGVGLELVGELVLGVVDELGGVRGAHVRAAVGPDVVDGPGLRGGIHDVAPPGSRASRRAALSPRRG